jgi:hypothetical protein
MAEPSPSEQLAGFIAKFDPAMAKTIREIRATLRRRFPTANELVFERYHFLAIGYCATERQSDTLVSITALASGVTLHFYYGSALPDPHGLLQGSGNQNRLLRLDEGAATLLRPEVEELLQAACDHAKTPLRDSGGGKLIIRSVSEKQRSRRVK